MRELTQSHHILNFSAFLIAIIHIFDLKVPQQKSKCALYGFQFSYDYKSLDRISSTYPALVKYIISVVQMLKICENQ